MGAFAARVGDPTSHGGIVTAPGAPTVLIEGLPAARVTDMHTCPMVGASSEPHVGGPILPPGEPTVLISGLPAARVFDWATCVGPLDAIIAGASRTMIGQVGPPLPPVPSVSTAGGGSSSWFHYHHYVAVYEFAYFHDYAMVFQVYQTAVAIAAAAFVVAVAVVVYPYVSRSGELPDWPAPPGGPPDPPGDLHAFRLGAPQEGVRDDAEMYFLR